MVIGGKLYFCTHFTEYKYILPNMKKSSLVINVVLAIAMVVLYVLHFMPGEQKEEYTSKKSEVAAINTGEKKIAFVYIDSVFSNYQMSIDLEEELKQQAKTSEAKLASEERAYKKKVEQYQYDVQKQLITRAKAAETEQTLMQEQQVLLQLQNNLRLQLAEEEQVARRKVLDGIEQYLKKAESSGNYTYILGTAFGGNILYADDRLDITGEVIEGLNADYNASKVTE